MPTVPEANSSFQSCSNLSQFQRLWVNSLSDTKCIRASSAVDVQYHFGHKRGANRPEERMGLPPNWPALASSGSELHRTRAACDAAETIFEAWSQECPDLLTRDLEIRLCHVKSCRRKRCPSKSVPLRPIPGNFEDPHIVVGPVFPTLLQRVADRLDVPKHCDVGGRAAAEEGEGKSKLGVARTLLCHALLEVPTWRDLRESNAQLPPYV